MSQTTSQNELTVGASQVAALFGAHPFLSTAKLYEDIINPQPISEGVGLKLGKYLEPGLIRYFCEDKLGDPLAPEDGFQNQRVLGAARATVDAILLSPTYKRRTETSAILEIKTYGFTGHLDYHDDYGRGGSDQVPASVMMQVQLQMELHQIATTFVGTLSPRGPVLHRIAYDPGLGELLYSTIQDFHRKHLLTRIPPDPDKPFVEIPF